MIDLVSADKLLTELAKMHDPAKGWIFFPEFRFGTGYGLYSDSRLDAWAINAWPSYRARKITAPHVRRAFEIKVNASDVLKELRDPDKRWVAYSISHEFYFVTPQGLIDRKLLTKDDGLIEWNGESLRIVKPARVREAMPPRWSFVAALARRVEKTVKEVQNEEKRI